MKARDLLASGESAVVIFTSGGDFYIREGGNGSTGNWPVNPSREYDRVIVYRRDERTGTNDIYLARPAAITKSPAENRYVIGLVGIRHVGTSDQNWFDFAEGGPFPIRYLP